MLFGTDRHTFNMRSVKHDHHVVIWIDGHRKCRLNEVAARNFSADTIPPNYPVPAIRVKHTWKWEFVWGEMVYRMTLIRYRQNKQRRWRSTECRTDIDINF